MQAALASLPRELSSIYDRLWLGIETLSPPQKQRTKTALAVLMYRSPLPVSFVNEIILQLHEDIQQTGEDDLATHTAQDWLNTRFMQTNDGNVGLIHATVREYLNRNESSLGLSVAQLNRLPELLLQHEINFPERNDEAAPKQHIGIQPIVDSEDNESVVSFTSSILSTITSNSSQTSIFSQLETVSEQFARLFTGNPQANSLILRLLDTSGIAGFEQFFAELLIQYSNDLQAIASTGAEKVASVMAGERTHLISRQIIEMSGYLEKAVSKSPSVFDQPKTEAWLDQYLAQQDRAFIKTAPAAQQTRPITVASTVRSTSSTKRYSPSGPTLVEDDQEVYVNLERVKQFLTSTKPFRLFVDKMEAQIQSRSKPPLTQLPEIPPVVEVDLHTGALSWRKRVSRQLLKIIPGGERPLDPAMKRVRWTCVSVFI